MRGRRCASACMVTTLSLHIRVYPDPIAMSCCCLQVVSSAAAVFADLLMPNMLRRQMLGLVHDVCYTGSSAKILLSAICCLSAIALSRL